MLFRNKMATIDAKPVDILIESVTYSLNILGYPKQVNTENLINVINKGDQIEYSEYVSWLSHELKTVCNLEELITSINGPEDEEGFRMELSSFLRELKSPYLAMVSEQDPVNRLAILNYLCTELQAARIANRTKLETEPMVTKSPISHLRNAAVDLGILDQLSDDNTPLELLQLISKQVQNILQQCPDLDLSEPLFTDTIDQQQWRDVEQLNEKMVVDYRTRAEMLLRRLDVTMQSFSWSDRLKSKRNEITQIYRPLRRNLYTEPTMGMADLLAARKDLTSMEKIGTTNLSLSKLHKARIVGEGPPDRGGRPKDVLRMPQWKERIVEGGGGPEHGKRGGRKKEYKGKRKPWKEDPDNAGPSGTVSMTRRSRKKSKRDSDEGIEITDATQL